MLDPLPEPLPMLDPLWPELLLDPLPMLDPLDEPALWPAELPDCPLPEPALPPDWAKADIEAVNISAVANVSNLFIVFGTPFFL